jgi:transmembrane sensor
VASSDDIDAAAADWLARLDRLDWTAELSDEFEAWCRADPRHYAAYLRLQTIWDRLDGLREAPPTPTPEPHPPGAPACDVTNAIFARTRWSRLAVAAALLGAVAGLWFWLSSGPPRPAMTPQRYVTTIGGFERLELSDRSVVQLNTDSELLVTFTSTRRDLELLRGEATFDVTPDQSRPFVVTAGKTAVRALGTRFNVHETSAGIEVMIMEGAVTVGAAAVARTNGATEVVAAGQVALASPARLQVKDIDQGELARRLAWQQGMVGFSGQSLAEVVAEFNRYNERKLVIEDPAAARLRIGGYFRARNLEAFVRVIEERFGIVATRESSRIVLRSRTQMP